MAHQCNLQSSLAPLLSSTFMLSSVSQFRWKAFFKLLLTVTDLPSSRQAPQGAVNYMREQPPFVPWGRSLGLSSPLLAADRCPFPLPPPRSSCLQREQEKAPKTSAMRVIAGTREEQGRCCGEGGWLRADANHPGPGPTFPGQIQPGGYRSLTSKLNHYLLTRDSAHSNARQPRTSTSL